MNCPKPLLVLVAAAGLAACATQSPAQPGQASSAADATAAPAASPMPKAHRPNLAHMVALVTESPSPSPPESPPASAIPSPAPRKHIVVPMRPPNAPPQIVDVEVNTTNVGSGDTLWGKVLTSSNVASVEVRVANVGVGLDKIGVGRFTLKYRLGSIPFFVHGTYAMYIIARNTRGDKVERTLPLTIH